MENNQILLTYRKSYADDFSRLLMYLYDCGKKDALIRLDVPYNIDSAPNTFTSREEVLYIPSVDIVDLVIDDNPKNVEQLNAEINCGNINSYYYILKLLHSISMHGNSGHTYKIIVNKTETFTWDGDGSDYIISVNNMKNWHNISLDEKKATIAETAKIIEYIYGSSLEIGFYTSEEYRKKNNLKEDVPVYGAYASKGKIFFNTDRLADDNFMGVYVLFHEFMHKRQSEADFENQIVNRLFKTAVYNAFTYEQQNIDPASYEYGDFYSIIPQEVHAYGMQKFVESKIIEKTGIEKTQETASKTTLPKFQVS